MTVLPVPRPRKKPVNWVTGVPIQSRRHRATGERKGRKPNNDAVLRAIVRALMDRRGVTSIAARRTVAECSVLRRALTTLMRRCGVSVRRCVKLGL
jgi:hypothetical protein